jgi:hypothetical protein
MPVFFVLMVVGLVGMALMAVPGLLRHGHAGHGGHAGPAAHGTLVHGTHGSHGASAAHAAHSAHGRAALPSNGRLDGLLRLFAVLPSPRVVFSILTLVGAFGCLITATLRLPVESTLIAAVLLALVFERVAINPLWNALFRFAGKPSAPLQDLVTRQARAVTPFRNGRGIVSVERDGRAVQFRAELGEPYRSALVRVGDALLIEEIDSTHESVTVSPV